MSEEMSERERDIPQAVKMGVEGMSEEMSERERAIPQAVKMGWKVCLKR